MVQTKFTDQFLDVHAHLTRAQYRYLLQMAVMSGGSLSLCDLLRADPPLHLPQWPDEDDICDTTEFDGFSVITWCNDIDTYRAMVLPSLAPSQGFQRTSYEVQFLGIPPEVGARNIGEAYELGRKLARHKIKIYIHQDAMPTDWQWLEKVRLAHMAGIQGTGVIGAKVPTGSAWFHIPSPVEASGYIDMGTGRIVGDADERVRVVDGLVFTCSADIPWSTEYEGPHMAVEDMCMRIEQAGGQVWCLSTSFMHMSPGSMDPGFWRSLSHFREVWANALPEGLRSIDELYEYSVKERESIGLTLDGAPTTRAKSVMAQAARNGGGKLSPSMMAHLLEDKPDFPVEIVRKIGGEPREPIPINRIASSVSTRNGKHKRRRR